MSTVAILVVIGLLLLLTYAGARDGAFSAAYVLVRNLIAFLCAMTLCQPLAMVLSGLIPHQHPAPDYFVAVSFVGVFGLVIVLGRMLKIKYTFPQVECPVAVERIVGVSLGFLNAIVVTGVILIMWSLLPFVRYIPADYGRIHIGTPALDTGVTMLRFYRFVSERMAGNSSFPLEDEKLTQDANGNERADPGDAFEDDNTNGKWDRGWLWKYHSHADIWLCHLDLLQPEAPGPPSVGSSGP